MKTIALQIGNTDDKLTQSEWHDFVKSIKSTVARWSAEVHFFGASPNYESWQNAAWIVSCQEKNVGGFHSEVVTIRKKFGQDSLAWLEGETVFV